MSDPDLLTMELLTRLMTPSGLGTLPIDSSGQENASEPGRLDAARAGAPGNPGADEGDGTDTRPAP